ncbi:DUF418 domain-containing protein [Isoptericola sp. S6320L]|uniref:DUF418 domain-containing protein n=1 Tax=Isoptericola sp. S6320L TaxID=2926411 RepID=UPI001FF5D90A|nr:DUF418 domain-containing protein [Isoptericola sp. S6320L]MCK0118563.1 DUF418 domain-containing protein [Isoptericola sp. S6320L]
MTAPDVAPPGVRALAPDLARGLMLLLIALANVPWFLYGTETSLTSAHREPSTVLDGVWQSVAIVAVDGRSYPLFAFLFGYGIWQSFARQRAAGLEEPAVRRVLQRRHGWLLVFGAVHAALLWFGDVLGAYGLAGLLVVWLFLGRATRTLLIWAATLTGVVVLVALGTLALGAALPPELSDVPGDANPDLAGVTPYLASILPRLGFWLPLTVTQGVFGLMVPVAVLLGIASARARVLEEPGAHRRALTRTAVVGIAVGWLGAVPSLLVHLGTWDVPEWTPVVLHLVTGLFAALGYAALFALLALRVTTEGTPGHVVGALTAVGQRSLTSYLLQSVIFAPLLCAWGLGLGGVLDQWQAALVAVATWLVTVVVAVGLARNDRRGPAERVLRVLTYRGTASSATPVSRPAP